MISIEQVTREILPFLQPGSVSPPGAGEPMADVEAAMCEVAFSGVVIPRRLKAMFLDEFEPYYFYHLGEDPEGGDFFVGPDVVDYFPKFVAMEPVIDGRQVRYTYEHPFNEPYPD